MRAIALPFLTLEPQTAAHAEEMFAILCDPALYQYENEPPPSVTWLRERFRRLETRLSPDGQQQWLNWVLRLPTSELIGYVQASVFPDHRAEIAYVVGSRHWGQGYARRAVQAMIGELIAHHGVQLVAAVLKRANRRSLHLLECLGFAPASPQAHAQHHIPADELLMQCAVLPAMM